MRADGQPEVEPRHRDLKRLLAYWQDKCDGRAFPRRADIDVLDLGYMLERIALTEVHDAPGGSPGQPRRYRLRVVGSWWTHISGVELTGTWLDDWPQANLRKLTVDTYESLISGRRPLCAVRDAWVDERKLSYEIMLLPLSEDSVRISMIMTAIGPSV